MSSVPDKNRNVVDYVRLAAKAANKSETGYVKIPRGELIELVIKAKTCPQAREQVLYAVYPYIMNIVYKTHVVSNAMDRDDVFQSTIFGLVRAIEKYDPTLLNEYGNPMSFTTYLTHWIKQTATRSVENESNLIRLPCHINKTMKRVNKLYNEWCVQNKEVPKPLTRLSVDFLEQFIEPPETRTSLESLLVWMEKGNFYDSLDEIQDFGGEEGQSLVESIEDKNTKSPEQDLLFDLDQKLVTDEIMKLPQRKRLVIMMRFGVGPFDEYTLSGAGDVLGLTRERVRQIESLSLRMLKNWLGRKGDEYAGSMISKSGSTKKDIVTSDILKNFTEEQIKYLLTEQELENLYKTVDFDFNESTTLYTTQTA